jgi:hypothetical protein
MEMTVATGQIKISKDLILDAHAIQASIETVIQNQDSGSGDC